MAAVWLALAGEAAVVLAAAVAAVAWVRHGVVSTPEQVEETDRAVAEQPA